MTECKKKSAKEKCNFILCLGNYVQPKKMTIVDKESKKEKDLSEDLKKIYTTSSEKAIKNSTTVWIPSSSRDQHHPWIDMFCHSCKYWTNWPHLKKVYPRKKGVQDNPFAPKIIEPLEIVSTVTKMTLDEIIRALVAEIDRRMTTSMLIEKHVADDEPAKNFQAYYRDHGRGCTDGRSFCATGFCSGFQGGFCRCGRDCFNFSGRVCNFCGKPGHFIKDYWNRIKVEENGKIHKLGHHGRDCDREYTHPGSPSVGTEE